MGDCKIDVSKIEGLQEKLSSLTQSNIDDFIDSVAREITARLLVKVVKRTPTGDYPKSTGKVGGTLKRGWTGGKKQTDISTYVEKSLKINHFGDMTTIEVINPVYYAPYVEYGHRRRGGKGPPVPGKHMLSMSAKEIQDAAPKIVEAKIVKFLKEVF